MTRGDQAASRSGAPGLMTVSGDLRTPRLGALPSDGACDFCVWAPDQAQVNVHFCADKREVSLQRYAQGYHRGRVERVLPGARYFYRLADGALRPDPASRAQPDGVHEASEVVDLSYPWTDRHWHGRPLSAYVIYELHVGTFSKDGTFEAVIPHLESLRDLGITALEIMPVAEFAGSRNWGYDGVYPFAALAAYGGARELQRLVDACHAHDLAVLLDVVYNHLGPEGNYLREFGPYFTDTYVTPWGEALNFDGPQNEGVRSFFIQNAASWITDFHFDGLRLDAVHAILDHSATPFLEELAEAVHAAGRRQGREVAVIAESDQNDPRTVAAPRSGGLGMDAMWCDDFHHAAHALLTGETNGYYCDYGKVSHLAAAWQTGMTYGGEYSDFRKRRHGRRSQDLQPHNVVICTQNHDQIGNRLRGDRLAASLDLESLKLAAGVTILSPFVPLLFMGEEYGETAPFQYFTSHSDAALVEAVRRGRKEEFSSFGWTDEVPDPQAAVTFDSCVLRRDKRHEGAHGLLYDFYRDLLLLRRQLHTAEPDEVLCFERQQVLAIRRGGIAWMMFNFSQQTSAVTVPIPEGDWQRALASSEERWGGEHEPPEAFLSSSGEISVAIYPRAFVVYMRPELSLAP